MLKVIALCDDLGRALMFWRRIGGIADVELHLVVANSGDRATWRTIASHAKRLVSSGPSSAMLVVSLLLRRRIRFFAASINDERVVNHVSSLRADAGLHGAGCIYREPLIQAFRLGILNAHIGLLPRYRGRSVMEWSLLEGQQTGITVFFIDGGIDTGARIVIRREFPVLAFQGIAAAKAYLFDRDAELYAEALLRLLEPGQPMEIQLPEQGRRYFVMSKLFSGVVEQFFKSPS